VKRKAKQRGRSRKTNRQDASRPTIEQQRTQASSDEAGRSNGSEEATFEEALAELDQDESAELDKLPPKRQAFVLALTGAAGFNGAKAARMAGYSERSARQIASELLTFPDVKVAVDARMKALVMSADEVLGRLSEQARADISPYLTSREGALYSLYLDLDRLKADGLGHLIKEIWETPEGIRVKIHDAQAALVQLGRYHKLFVDQVDLKSGGKPITVSNVQAIEPPGGEEPDDGSADQP
jgi:hypothetical protein